MKKITTLVFTLACSTPVWAEPVPKFDEFLTIMRTHDCKMTFAEATQIFVEGAGFELEELKRVNRYAMENGIAHMENGIAHMENASRANPGGELLILSDSSCKG
ncbi:hypothetical protein [Pseudophaeobacter sp.]|uniref:hypothetical protein n=1 Tax=Pseudophaeobacter sp. TaxID=1971739 RepID=UPI0026309302|nr:hypothetical protein [Pseudophaeobacter sp.]